MTPVEDRIAAFNGLETPPTLQALPLRAGPLSLSFVAGDLRWVALGEREIARRITVAVRDRQWGTVPNRLSNTRIEQGDDWFQITYDAENRQGEIDFAWQATLSGDAQGTLTFAFTGQARSTFLSNRLGLVLLHPGAECAGAASREERVDGTWVEASFPRHLLAQLPFEDIRALAHEVQPGLWAEARFSGEVFEMEDQRNYGDASFKTYSPPSRPPLPKTVPAGARFAQSVTLRLLGDVPPATLHSTATPVLTIGSQPVGPMPRLGLGAASHGQTLTRAELDRLRALRLSHVRVDLRFGAPDWRARLRRAAGEARALDAELELAVFLSDQAEAELTAVLAELAVLHPAVARWLVFSAGETTTTETAARLARERVAAYGPAALVVGGTDVYYMQINSQRPPIERLDGVCFSINPQVHTFDTPCLMENVEAPGVMARSARVLADGKPVSISPLTLRPRFNPGGAGPEPAPGPGELPPSVDARQTLLAGAAWTVGCLQSLAEAGGVGSVTLYETTGWRGLMETAAGSPLPEAFPSWPGMVFPLYHVLADAATGRESAILPVSGTRARHLAALAWRSGEGITVLAANLTGQEQQVTVAGLGAPATLRYLDETNARLAATEPERYRFEAGGLAPNNGQVELTLRPYSVARVDAGY